MHEPGMTTVWDYANTLEIEIDRPASQIWPFFFGSRKDLWTRSEYTTVAGEPGAVGEIFMHEYSVLGERSFFFYEAVRVKPENQLVLKITCRKKPADRGELIGYDVISLRGGASRSTVILQQFIAFPTDIPQSALAVETEKHDRFLADILQHLKRLVELSGL